MDKDLLKWPDMFPKPTIESYNLKPQSSIVQTSMESGVARQRQRFTSIPWNVNVRWIMNNDTFAVFESWYRYKAKEGASWVIMGLQNGLGFKNSETRFLKPYSSKIISDELWEVKAKLEVREMSTLSEWVIDMIFRFDFTIIQLEKYANRLHEFIHVKKATIFKW